MSGSYENGNVNVIFFENDAMSYGFVQMFAMQSKIIVENFINLFALSGNIVI